MVLTSIFFYGKIEAKRGIIVAKVIMEPFKEYVEYGYVILPIQRNGPDDRVMYPVHTVIQMPKGYQLSGAKSQNDIVRFGSFDDIIRIYALVPANETEMVNVDIFVIPTGMPFTAQIKLSKLTIIKEAEGEFIWHIYHKAED